MSGLTAPIEAIELRNVIPDRIPENSSKENIRDDVLPPDNAVEALQQWNEPRINMWRVFATYYSFFIFGMNDGAYGVDLPPIYLQPISNTYKT